ncbi:solute carrier family 35 member G1-like [Tachypleus tridentatus]|uniref:solute carrier family 35 member G1-like n=1 Tax=Tachypleus tridentatus TaxID=6853 RepID=UPI003FD5116F
MSESTVLMNDREQDKKVKNISTGAPETAGSPFRNFKFPYIGIILAIACPVFYATQSALFKMIPHLSKQTILFYRGMYMVTITCPLVIHSGQSIFSDSLNNFLFLVLRGTMSTGASVLMYNSLNFLPLGNATCLIMTESVLTTIFAYIILREKVHLMDLLAIALSMTGIILVCRPPFIFDNENNVNTSNQVIGSLMALGSSVFNALSQVITRKIMYIHYSVVIFQYSLLQIILLGIYMFTRAENILSECGTTSCYVLAIGITSFLCQYFIINALFVEDAGCVSLIRSFQIVLAFIYQVVLLGEVVTLLSGLGAVFITSAVVIKACLKWYTENPTKIIRILGKVKLRYLILKIQSFKLSIN